MTKRKIAVTTASFTQESKKSLGGLKNKGFSFIFNSRGRTLKESEVLNFVRGCEGVIAGTEPYRSAVLEKLQSLKVISRCGAGIDSIDLKKCRNLKIKVLNTPDAPTQAVAELTVGLMLNLLRKISLSDREIRKNVWQKRAGRLFCGRKVGIIGFGRIGKAVAVLCKKLNASVVYYDAGPARISLKGYRRLGLKELLKASDIISIHIPFAKENYNFIGTREFKLMKPGALLVNCSRGGIVNEKALCAALKEKLAGAAVDVFEQEPYDGPLRALPNVILTPHIGSYTEETRIQMEREALSNLMEGLNRS